MLQKFNWIYRKYVSHVACLKETASILLWSRPRKYLLLTVGRGQIIISHIREKTIPVYAPPPRQSRLAQYYWHFYEKALLLVPPTVLEIFYQDFYAKALVLVNPTVLEIFYQDFYAKALLLLNPTVLEIFYQIFLCKSPSF